MNLDEIQEAFEKAKSGAFERAHSNMTDILETFTLKVSPDEYFSLMKCIIALSQIFEEVRAKVLTGEFDETEVQGTVFLTYTLFKENRKAIASIMELPEFFINLA